MRRSLAGALAALLAFTPSSPAWATVVQAVAPAASSAVAPVVVPLSAGNWAGSASLGLSPLSGPGLSPDASLRLPSVAAPVPVLPPLSLSPAEAAALPPAPISPLATARGETAAPPAAAPAPAALRPGGTSVAAAAAAARPAQAAPSGVPASRPARPLRERIAGLQDEQGRDLKALPGAAGEGAYGIARDGFSRLLGLEETSQTYDSRMFGTSRTSEIRRSGTSQTYGSPMFATPARMEPPRLGRLLEPAAASEAPAPPSVPAQTKKDLRIYLTGTAVFKIGMDALSLAVPLMALSVFGSAGWAATFTAVWVLSQAVSSSFAGGLLDRRSPVKVLSWTMALQAAAVAAMVGVCALDASFPLLLGFKLANPVTLLTLYALAGASLGVSDTARQVLPPRLVGGDERALKIFNAKAHTAYELAGVSSALLAGLSIKLFGLLPTLMIHPPAYLLAALLFSRLRLGSASAAPQTPGSSDDAERAQPASSPFRDFLDGARTVLSDPTYAWASLALVVPLVVHKVFEGLLLPVTAKVLLGDPSSAAWLLGASNLGELLGAMLLLKVMASPAAGDRQHSQYWVRFMGVGLLALWSLSLTGNLWLLLPLATAKSMTWAASDLSLRSKLQNSLPADHRGRALGFINSAAFLLTLSASMGLGFLFDAAPPLTVLYGIGAAVTVLSAAMLWAAHRLKAPKK